MEAGVVGWEKNSPEQLRRAGTHLFKGTLRRSRELTGQPAAAPWCLVVWEVQI